MTRVSFADVKRRRVFRALVGYGLAAFAILQVAEPVMHGLRWPEAVLSWTVVALAVGFPVVIAVAWALDLRAPGAASRSNAIPIWPVSATTPDLVSCSASCVSGTTTTAPRSDARGHGRKSHSRRKRPRYDCSRGERLLARAAWRRKMFEGLFQPTHLILILVVALLIFGPSKLPEIGAGLGKSIRDFKKAMAQAGDDAAPADSAKRLPAPSDNAAAMPRAPTEAKKE